MNRPLDTAAKSPTEAALDRTIAMMIREARIDPCAFVRMILMGAAWAPLPRVHIHLQNHLSAHRLALVELPRDHGKTTQVCLRVLWELGRDPNLRIKIVCASESIAIGESGFARGYRLLAISDDEVMIRPEWIRFWSGEFPRERFDTVILSVDPDPQPAPPHHPDPRVAFPERRFRTFSFPSANMTMGLRAVGPP